ncbi:MAG: DUF1217 domain-containing protein [Brevirhabdus sp.]
MVLSIGGLGSTVALNLIDATRGRQIETMRNEPVNKRAEEAFRERIGDITTPEELVKDFEVYSFVMRAFDLEDQIFGRGMMRRILESDPSDEESLLTRLTDPRFNQIHTALGFTTSQGPQTPDFTNPVWVEAIVQNFYNTAFINENDAQNETVGTVLKFRDKFAGLTSWYNVLKDKDLTQFFQVALSIPTEVSGLDLEMQVKIMDEKFDLTKLADPKERERLITRYMAISDVLNPQGFNVNSTALSVLQNSSLGGQFVPITLDVPTVSYSAISLYRS